MCYPLDPFPGKPSSYVPLGLKNDPLEIRDDGCLHVPSGPGSGVGLDWDWLDDHTVEVIRGCAYG